MSQVLIAVCSLGIVIGGLLVMVRVIDLGELVRMIGKMFVLIVAVLIALCMLKTVIVPALISALLSLKHVIASIAAMTVLAAVLMLVARIAGFKFQKWLRPRGHDQER